MKKMHQRKKNIQNCNPFIQHVHSDAKPEKDLVGWN